MRKSGRTLSPKAYSIQFIPDVEISKCDFPWYELAIWLLSSSQMKKMSFFYTHRFHHTKEELNKHTKFDGQLKK